jgi:hypothetical protein
MQRYCRAATTALALAVLAAGPALAETSVASEGVWSTPASLDAQINSRIHPQIAYNTSGDAVVAWDGRKGLRVATRDAGGAWSAPVDLGVDLGDDYNGPAADIDEWGNATVVWRDHTCFCIHTATRPAGGAWTAETLDGSNDTPEYPDVASYGNGGAMATWDSRNTNVMYSVRHADGSWTRPHRLMRGWVPRIEANAEGDVVIAALTSASVYRRIEAVYRPAGGTWSRVAKLSRSSESVGSPHPAMNDSGGVVVTWAASGHEGFDPVVVAVATASGGMWSRETTLSSPDEELSENPPAAAIDAAGRAFVTWSERIADGRQIQAAVMTPAGEWGPVATISPPGTNADAPAVAALGHGSAAIVWLQGDGTQETVQSAFRVGQTWSDLQQVAGTDYDYSYGPAVASDTAGHTTAAFAGYAKKGAGHLLVSDYLS